MWTLPNRSGFKLDVSANDGELWGIGMIVVQWAHVEAHMNLFLSHLTLNDPEAANAVRAAGDIFIRRIKLWRDRVEARMLEPHRSRVSAIIDRVSETQKQRDNIVHNQFAQNPDLGISGIMKWRHGWKPFEWALNYDGLKKVALRIDGINADLIGFMMDISGPDQLFGPALQRILRPPNQT